MVFGCHTLDLKYPRIMGILNVTPDSFSDGGQLLRGQSVDVDALLNRAEQMIDAGADILDVGGESTRPGADPVSEMEELDRVLVAVDALTMRFDTIVSVDTSTPSVMVEAANLRIGLLNDVRGFRRPGALEAAAGTDLPVCVMHMRGEPDTMQTDPSYSDVISDIATFFGRRLNSCDAAGINPSKVILDPGFGFGKTSSHNFEILARLNELCVWDCPLLVGLSRKSMISSLLGRPPQETVFASAALALLAVQRGASIVRVHDVQATADALAMYNALPRGD